MTGIRTKLEKLLLVTPVLFAVHNAEEVLMMRRMGGSNMMSVHYALSPDQFAIAIIILTVLGFVVTFAAWRFWGRRYFLLVMNGFLAGLLLNAFFPHIVATIAFGHLMPGVITAVIFYLPFSLYALWAIVKNDLLYRRHFIMSFIVGPIAGVLIAGLCLLVGYRAVP